MKTFDVAVSELLVREETDTALYSNARVSVVLEPPASEGEMRGLLPVCYAYCVYRVICDEVWRMLCLCEVNSAHVVLTSIRIFVMNTCLNHICGPI